MKLDQSVFTYSFEEATILANMWSKYGEHAYYTAVNTYRDEADLFFSTGTWLVTNKYDPRVIK